VDRPGLVTGRRLAVISHTPHHHGPAGLVGWGPTVTELSHLASRFDEVVHVAPVHDGPPPASALPYTADNLTVLPVRPAGGDGIAAKAGLVTAVPGWLTAMHRGTRGADVLHVRCPANLSGLALAVLRARRDQRPLWVKYAGNWRPDGDEPWSYRTQRRWLRAGFGNVAVTVNGAGDDPEHVRAFANPSLTDDDLARGSAAAAAKAPTGDGVRLAFVGRVEPEKGAPEAVATAALVHAAGHRVHLTVVGEGPSLDACRAAAGDAGFDAAFPGWLPRTGVHDVLADAHALLLPSRASEGWPKVLSEAMAFGAVPVTSTVSSIPQVFAETGAGVAVAGTDPEDHAAAVLALVEDPARLAALRAAGLAAADRFTFTAHLAAVDALFADRWGIDLGARP
jgi:glycosyltransferase involved in cell wall biosynthesis